MANSQNGRALNKVARALAKLYIAELELQVQEIKNSDQYINMQQHLIENDDFYKGIWEQSELIEKIDSELGQISDGFNQYYDKVKEDLRKYNYWTTKVNFQATNNPYKGYLDKHVEEEQNKLIRHLEEIDEDEIVMLLIAEFIVKDINFSETPSDLQKLKEEYKYVVQLVL